MKTILIVTNSRDLTVDYIISKYGTSVNMFRFNVDLLDDYEISFSNIGSFFRIITRCWSLHSSQIDAVYYRKPILPDLSAYHHKFRNMMQKDIMTLIDGITESVGETCLTRPSILKRADNKILQLRLAKEIGFSIPVSLITNAPKMAQKICSETQSIVKPLSIGRIVYGDRLGIIQTNLVNNNVDFEDLSLSPAYFQQYVKKDTEVRVTIIDENIFAVKIDSTNPIDWRKLDAVLSYELILLPQDIKTKCFEMMKALQLSFGAFDFIVHEGKYVFLEVNANGQWLWLEEALKLNISEAIINHLTGDFINE